jgi:hypothetical protein
MGMFDVVILSKPLACSTCGAEITHFQTKEFDCALDELRIGSVLNGSSIRTGIIQDWAFCDACHKADRESKTDLFMVVWHSILAGVETTEEAAHQRLASIDRLDLLAWIDEAQRREEKWKQKFFGLQNDLVHWRDYLEDQKRATENPDSPQRRFPRFFLPDESIRNAENPLTALIEKHSTRFNEGLDD